MYAIAVLDVGKTNKKIQLYSDSLEVLDSVSRSIPTLAHEGLEVENVGEIEAWFKARLRDYAASWPIRVVSITTHGATGVCVGEDGLPCVPVASYTNEVAESVHEEFFRLCGTPVDLQRETATAEVRPLINFGKLLYYLKRRFPEDFARTRHVLMYPQYFGFRFTGEAAADYTSVGCHSYLWDFARNDWSSVVDRLAVRGLVPPRPRKPSEVLGRISPEAARETGLAEDVIVTLGVHDSNSALVPYLVTEKGDFVLNSTGTWCVAMRPDTEIGFRNEELGSMVFYNIAVTSQPVKTSILLGGLEFETYTGFLKSIHGHRPFPPFDERVYARIAAEKRLFILPSVVPGAGQFPHSRARVVENGREYLLADIRSGAARPEFFRDYASAYAALNLSVALQTRVALERVGLGPGTALYVEGGFHHNEDYNRLLTAFFPDSPLSLTSIREASSFGAAMLGKAAAEKLGLESLSSLIAIEKIPVPSSRIAGLDDYGRNFLALAAARQGSPP